jgi:hypothetical protein
MKNTGDKCPSCGSDNLSIPRYSAAAFALSFLLFGIPIFFKSKVRFCFDCSSSFKVSEKLKNDLSDSNE